MMCPFIRAGGDDVATGRTLVNERLAHSHNLFLGLLSVGRPSCRGLIPDPREMVHVKILRESARIKDAGNRLAICFSLECC